MSRVEELVNEVERQWSAMLDYIVQLETLLTANNIPIPPKHSGDPDCPKRKCSYRSCCCEGKK